MLDIVMLCALSSGFLPSLILHSEFLSFNILLYTFDVTAVDTATVCLSIPL